VTLTAADDLLVDGPQVSTITVSVVDANSDNAWDPLADKTVGVTTHDNDAAGLHVSKTSATVSEPNTTDTFTGGADRDSLNERGCSRSPAVNTTRSPGRAGHPHLTPANWSAAQTVTLTAATTCWWTGRWPAR